MAATPRSVDLTNVKEGGNFRPRRKPEGDYKMKIVKADDHTPGQNAKDKTPGWVLTIMVDGDARSTYPYYLSPTEKQAWKIRGIMIAAGFSAKAARIKFDPNKLVGKAIGAALEDDEYDGKLKSVIADVFPVSEVGANADEDAPEDDYDDADAVPDDEVDVPEDDEDEEPPAPAPKRRTTRAKVAAPVEEPEDDEDEDEPEPESTVVVRRRRAPAPAPEPEDDDEDEEEAPAPPPRRRRAAAPPAKAAPRKRAAAPPVEDDDDLDDLDTDDLD